MRSNKMWSHSFPSQLTQSPQLLSILIEKLDKLALTLLFKLNPLLTPILKVIRLQAKICLIKTVFTMKNPRGARLKIDQECILTAKASTKSQESENNWDLILVILTNALTATGFTAPPASQPFLPPWDLFGTKMKSPKWSNTTKAFKESSNVSRKPKEAAITAIKRKNEVISIDIIIESWSMLSLLDLFQFPFYFRSRFNNIYMILIMRKYTLAFLLPSHVIKIAQLA